MFKHQTNFFLTYLIKCVNLFILFANIQQKKRLNFNGNTLFLHYNMGLHAMSHYVKLVFSHRYHWLVVLIPRQMEIQIDLNVADQVKYKIKTSAYQVYEPWRIKYTRLFEELVCMFAVKF